MAHTMEMELRGIRKVVIRPCIYTTDGADDDLTRFNKIAIQGTPQMAVD